MAGTTTKHEIPFLEGTDMAAEIDTVNQAQAERIDDIIAIDSQGTFALRPVSSAPSPGKPGRYYWATDTGKLYRDHGTGWTEIVVGGDSRLSDQRTPTDGSVTVAKTGTGDNGLARGCFSAYNNGGSGMSWSSGAINPITLWDESFDVSGWFDVTTGRFTPQVAGLYRLSFSVGVDLGGSVGQISAQIRKNGNIFKRFQIPLAVASGSMLDATIWGSAIVSANGTTDYFTLSLIGSSNWTFNTGEDDIWFEGQLIGRS